MKSIVATALATGSAAEAANALSRELHTQLQGAEPAVTLLFASTRQPLTELMPNFSQRWRGLTLGASTAGEFTEKGDAKDSVAAVAVSGDFAVHAGLGRSLKADPEGAVARAMKTLPEVMPGKAHRTALLMIDPLAGRSDEVVSIASRLLGTRARLAGGAAGDDLAMKSTYVGVNQEVANDAVVLATIFSTKPLGLGVHHGHSPLSKPLKVTRSSGNVVHEIDGRPALTVWKENTREHAAAQGIYLSNLPQSELGAFLLRYEAGISAGNELKIRAPLTADAHGAITFACGIPVGTTVRITESTKSRQVSSAKAAARMARPPTGAKCAGAIVFDCICRNLILGSDFGSAVKGISEELGGCKLAGFETYGEIALDAGDFSGFHNTTTVVLSIPE